ncbi:MAG: hypothetical protein ACMUEM_03295 [Flavobacteriales bacterium AspAUS03]
MHKLEVDLKGIGYAVKAIFSLTLPKGNERLHIYLHSFNTEKKIDGLLLQLFKNIWISS